MDLESLPIIPPLPTQPAPTWDQRMRDFEARIRREEYIQRERHNSDTERRHAALIDAYAKLTAAQKTHGDVMRDVLTTGAPLDAASLAACAAMTDAATALRLAVQAWQPGSGGGGGSDDGDSLSAKEAGIAATILAAAKGK